MDGVEQTARGARSSFGEAVDHALIAGEAVEDVGLGRPGEHRLDLAVVRGHTEALAKKPLEDACVAREVRTGEVLLLVAQKTDPRRRVRLAHSRRQAPAGFLDDTARVDKFDHRSCSGTSLVTANPPRCPHGGHTAAEGMLSPPVTTTWIDSGLAVTGTMLSASDWSTHAGHQS